MEEENEGDEKERQREGMGQRRGQRKTDGQSSREATLEMCVCELTEGESPLRIAQH